MEGVLVIDSEEEEGRVECILRVEKKARSPWGFLWVDHFDHAESVPEELHVYHVSIEAECRGKDKTICSRLFFTGLAALTKKVLPGVPLTEIEPVEGKESLDMDSPKIEGLPCRCELMKARREALEDPGAPTLETRINWIEDDITRLWRAVDETNRVIQVVIAMSRKEGAEVLQEVPVLASTESPTDMNGDPNPDHVDPFPGAEPAPADNPVDNAGIPAGPPVTTPEDPDGEPSCEPGALAPEAEPPVEPGALSPPTEPHIDILVDDGLTREQARFIATLEALFKRA